MKTMGMKAYEGEALVLTCMDLRQMDEVAEYLGTTQYAAPREHNGTKPSAGAGLKDLYDHVAMAGAALGAVSPLKPHWNQAFWDHVDLAVALHKVKRLIIIEHQDCGAYKALFMPAFRRGCIGAANATKDGWADEEEEAACHYRMARALRNEVLRRTHKLDVEILYAALPFGSTHATIRLFNEREIERALREEAEDEKEAEIRKLVAAADQADKARSVNGLPPPPSDNEKRATA
ncbi:MAG: hypothetical protein KIT84_42825 [Labilithrix sp.]|nr:hypothetical protein [Labilithrix sp.]MCW5817813.1 hypothetical protein [Labilithrix sp.]